MPSFKVLYERLDRLEDKHRKVIVLLREKMEQKLGIGWSVDTNQSDGLVIVCPDDYNYSTGDLPNILKLPRDQAIAEIKKCPCD